MKNDSILRNQGNIKGEIFFENYHREMGKQWFYGKKYSRHLIVWVNRVRANQYHLAASLYKTNMVDNPLCKCNTADEDIDHVIWQISLFNIQRQKMIDKLCKIKCFPPHSIQQIVSQLDPKVLRIINSFIL